MADKRDYANNRDYMIDVAGQRHYHGQGSDYAEAYTAWRNDPENKYAYSFVHDSREHTYIDGEGFADRRAVTAEKEALRRCTNFLGFSMLILLLFQVLRFNIMKYAFNSDYLGWVYYSQHDDLETISAAQSYVYIALRVISLLSVLLIAHFTLKMPAKISLPHEKPGAKLFICGLCIALMFLIISRVFDYVLIQVFSQVNIDVSFYYYLNTDDKTAQTVYYLSEMIVSSVLIEIIFRGYILQLFRQFGDLFAIIISAFASAFCYHDISNIMYMFFLCIILGIITVINGSVYASILTRVVLMHVEALLNELSLVPDDLPKRFIEAIICLAVSAAAVYSLQKLTAEPYPRLNIHDEETEMTIGEKTRCLIYSNLFMIWLMLDVVAVVFSVRFI